MGIAHVPSSLGRFVERSRHTGAHLIAGFWLTETEQCALMAHRHPASGSSVEYCFEQAREWID